LFERPPPARAPITWSDACFTPVLLRYVYQLPLPCCVVSARDRGRWLVLTPSMEEIGILQFENTYANMRRNAYNARMFEETTSRRAALVGELGGHHDFFIPIYERGRITAHLVAGPFRRGPVTSDIIVDEWEELTHRRADRASAELLTYARCVLGTVSLDGPLFDACSELLSAVASIMSQTANAAAVTERFLAERALPLDTAPPVVFRMARGIVDPEWSSSWRHSKLAWNYSALGAQRMFTHVLAIAFDARAEDPRDPIDQIVRVHELQLHCLQLSREIPNTLAGQLAGQGAFLLVSASPPSSEGSVDNVVKQVRESIRRAMGQNACVGVSSAAADGDALPRAYDEALLALKWAVQENRGYVTFRNQERRNANQPVPYRKRVGDLHRAVSAGAAGAAEVAAHAFLREVLWRARGNFEVIRAYLEAALLELLEGLEQPVVIDRRALGALQTQLLQTLAAARNDTALRAAFVRAVGDIARSARGPKPASRRARLEVARRFIDRNLRLSLKLKDAAREADLSERYFSTLFKRTFGASFEAYVLSRRLERARHLLLTTALPISRVRRDAGFGSTEYFFRAFKKAYHMTPNECRRQGGRE
jgi:AraC-like DNA-binding protein